MEPELVGKRVMRLMEQHKIEIEELANIMKIDVKVLKGKLEGKEEFYLDEMIKLKNVFQLDTQDCDELFFQKTTEKEKNTLIK